LNIGGTGTHVGGLTSDPGSGNGSVGVYGTGLTYGTHPVGTRVRYWPIYPPIESVPPVDTVTRSEAWALGDGSVVVCVDGQAGGVHLSHIEVIP